MLLNLTMNYYLYYIKFNRDKVLIRMDKFIEFLRNYG
jgi:hypothetical protein